MIIEHILGIDTLLLNCSRVFKNDCSLEKEYKMLDVVMLNKAEFVLFIIAIIFIVFYYKSARYSKKEIIIWTLILIPFLYFSINMLTEVVTIDEPQYKECIADIRNLKNYSAANKVLFEYKYTQLTIGSVFWFLPEALRNSIGDNNIWMIYKALHWFLVYIISLITTCIWRNNIICDLDNYKKKISENTFLIMLIGSPLACLLMKVTNYDAGSTYPAILGIIILWAAYKQNNKKLGFIATLITALGVLDKWTALVYWIVVTVFYAFLSIKDKETLHDRVITSIAGVGKSYVGALLLSVLYFGYAWIQQDGFESDVDLGVVIFSFVHAVKGILSGDLSVNSSVEDVIYIPILYIAMVITSLLVCFAIRCLKIKRISAANVFLKFDAILLCMGVIGGAIGAYLIPLRVAPFLEIENGKYISTDSFDGWIYHYGANTAIGHFLAKICYQWATIVSNYPTFLLMLCMSTAVILFAKKYDDGELPCSLFLSSALAMLLMYSVAGLPVDARYYSYPIFVIGVCAVYISNKYLVHERKQIIGFFYFLCIVEMVMFIPNVKVFSPIWLWHDHKHNIEVRKGEWYAGEVYFWGEQVAIAGNIIEELISTDVNNEEVVIYSNYGDTWPRNPGYSVVDLRSQDESDLRFDENTYYVINKFWIFRSDIPSYLYQIDPVATIRYKGEIGAWIFRGDQLKGYSSELII